MQNHDNSYPLPNPGGDSHPSNSAHYHPQTDSCLHPNPHRSFLSGDYGLARARGNELVAQRKDYLIEISVREAPIPVLHSMLRRLHVHSTLHLDRGDFLLRRGHRVSFPFPRIRIRWCSDYSGFELGELRVEPGFYAGGGGAGVV